MRKLIFTLSAIAMLSQAYAQGTFRQKIKGEGGLSQHFTTLEQSQQVAFNPLKARSIFELDANSDLLVSATEKDQLGMTHYRYSQTFKGIPIEKAMYIAHTKAGILTGMSGSIVTEFEAMKTKPAAPSISGAEAIAAALGYVKATKYAWQDASYEASIKMQKGAKGTYYPEANLVWYSAGDEVDVQNMTLAYKIDVYSIAPRDRKYIYVDAKTSKVLGVDQRLKNIDAVGTAETGYSGTQTIHSDLNAGSYRLRDLTKGNGIVTLRGAAGHADYTNASANWALTGADKWALDAHFGVGATWSFYKDNFNRNSIDNAGFQLISWVNDPNNSDNASWDGSVMSFGVRSSNNQGVVGIDIAGHELTHGFTEKTSNLVYQREPGAMNESMSDIMGKSVQFYAKPNDINWQLSNDMGWIIRDMSNPNAVQQPDTYKGTYWENAEASFCFSIINDNCGVHTNSGVGNFMFYLLVTGGTGTNDIGNNYTVSGIGLAKADQILYRTNTTYLVSTSKYADWRTACINAATDLYGANSVEVNQVKNAWYAVGVGAAGSSVCTPAIPTSLASSAITSNSATVSWGAVAGAVSYTLEWKPASSANWTIVPGLTTTTYNLSGLGASTNYQFHVSSSCGGTTSAYSTTASFTTLAGTPTCTDVYEPNNSSSTSAAIAVNTPITAIIATATDKDYFKFNNTSAARNIKVTLSNLPADYDIRLYAPSGSQIGISQNAGTASETIVYNTGITGTFRILVASKSTGFSTDCYTLQADISSTAFPTTTTCEVPEPTIGSISQTGATISWLAITGAVSYDVQFKADAAASFTTVAGVVGTSYTLSGLTPATAYSYQVKTNCGTGTSAYSITKYFSTPPVTPEACSDIFEPNNSSSTAATLALNTPVSGLISPTNDKDYFKFSNASTARNIRVTLTNLPADYDIKLYAPSGSQIGISENVGTANETIVYNTSIVGTFRVLVTGKSGVFIDTVCYTLKVETSAAQQTLQTNSLIGFVAPTVTQQDVSVFPQPAKGVANLRFSASWKGATNVAISNQLGMKVGSVNMNVDGGIGKLDISGLRAGMYYLRISNGARSVTQKLVVER